MSAPAPPRARRRWWIVGLLVMLTGVAAGLLWYFSGDEPGAVDAERALQQDQDGLSDVLSPGDGDDAPTLDDEVDEPDNAAEASSDEAPRTPEDLDGRWIIDTSREFDRAAGRGTFVGYRIDEELSGIGASTAVGRSPEVDGEVHFDGATVTSVVVEADLTALVSDDGRRDGRVRSQLGPGATAAFVLDEPIELPEVPPVSEVIELTVSGTLTVLDVSEDVEVVLQAAVTETGLLITGSTQILLSDYDVEVPSAPIVLSASDEATLEWQLFLVRE